MSTRLWREAALVATAFVSLTLAVTWPLARHLASALPGDLGDPLLSAWILGWDAARLPHGLAGIWNAPTFYPYARSLTFSEHLLGVGVPVAPIIWISGNPILAYNVAFLASFVLAGGGMYLLVRRLTGRSDAAFLAALAYGFCPARWPQVSHLPMLMSGWMPLALWALHGYFQSRSTRALTTFGAACVLQTSSNLYFTYFLLVPIACVSAWELWRARPAWRRPAMELLAAGAVVGLSLLPIARVYARAHQDYGLQRSARDVQIFGADLGAYVRGSMGLVPRLPLWGLLPQVAKPAGPEGELFPGMTVLVFVAITWLWPRRRGTTADLESSPRQGAIASYAAAGAVALLLSLGTEPAAWGHPLPLGGPYRWLFAHLPGFDGLRVPARWSIVVHMALAVLVGAGVARVWTRRPSMPQRAALACVGLLIAMEGYPRAAALPLAPMARPGQDDRAAYTWLRDRSPGPLLELPIGAFDSGSHGQIYQYQTLFHHQPIVNGASGYELPLQTFLGGPASPLTDFDRFADAVHVLRALGVRTVAVHLDHFRDPAVGAAIVGALRARPDQVSAEMSFPGVLMFQLVTTDAAERSDWSGAGSDADRAESRVRPIAPSHFTAAASENGDRLARAFDGDLDTRWQTEGHQPGTEWIALAFDMPRNVRRVRFSASGRSVRDTPRELLVEGADAVGDFAPLYRGSIAVSLALGLVRDPQHAPVDVWLPPNRIRRLRILQLGVARSGVWAIDELSVWEPAPGPARP